MIGGGGCSIVPTISILDEPISAYRKSHVAHSGVSGMNWYVHKFGNWERHAKYANGQPNPETLGGSGNDDISSDETGKELFDKASKSIPRLSYRKLYEDKEYRKKWEKATDLGLLALNETRPWENFEVDHSSPDYASNRDWFLIEDQTIGFPEFSYLIANKIATPEECKRIIQYARDNRDKFMENYPNTDPLYLHISDASWGFDEFVDACGRIDKGMKYTGPKQKSNPESDAKRGSYDANRDLAIQLLSKGETYSPLQQAQANRDLNLLSDKLAGSLIGTTVSAATGGSARGNAAAGYVGGRINDIFMESRQIKGYNKRHNDNLRYRDVRFNGLTMGTRYNAIQRGKKKFNTALSKSTIKDLGLSKEYVQAYSDTMNIALRKYDSLGNKLYR